jgi:putative transposase
MAGFRGCRRSRIGRRMSRLIGDWIHFYNHRRPHQALNMKTPAEAFALAA